MSNFNQGTTPDKKAASLKATAEQQGSPCPKCGNKRHQSDRYGDVCLTCEPVYLSRCSCNQPLWACICCDPGMAE